MSHPFAARIDAIPSQVIAHVAHQHKATERLLHLDLALSKAASIRTALLADAVPSLLASRSVATFRSAFEVTLRGQLYESALMVRAIVECAGYCLVAAVKPGASAAWQLRERGPAELKAGRVTFSPEQCRIAIQDHVPEAVDQFNSLYEE